jgi:hypothetical protein
MPPCGKNDNVSIWMDAGSNGDFRRIRLDLDKDRALAKLTSLRFDRHSERRATRKSPCRTDQDGSVFSAFS